MLPFIKAPANLLYDVYQYTPGIKTAVDAYKGEFTAGGDRAQDAMARLLTGSTLWAGAASLAYMGHITDGGPQDTQALREMTETGWRPHSFVFQDGDGTNHYYPLDRIDPFGQILSMAADMHTIMGQVGREDAGRLAMHAVVAISKDSLSKNYLKNFADLLDAFGSIRDDQGADEKFGTLLKGMVGGLVPSQIAAANDDPLMRETRSLMDALTARIPGMSQTLDRRYNTLGEPVLRTPSLGPDLVSPFFHSVDSTVQAELSQIAASNPHGFKSPPKTMRLQDNLATPGVDLTALPSSNGHSAYDRLQQLIGDLGDGSPTLREQITSVMKSNPEFWFKPGPDGNSDYEGIRYKELNALLAGRREAAKGKLIGETPGLLEALKDDLKRGVTVLQQGGNAVAQPSVIPGVRSRP